MKSTSSEAAASGGPIEPRSVCELGEHGTPPDDCGEAGYADVYIDQGVAICEGVDVHCGEGYECDNGAKINLTDEQLAALRMTRGQCAYMCCRPIGSSSSSYSSSYASSSYSSSNSSSSDSSFSSSAPSSSSSPPSSSAPSSSEG
jgi:hypothetical protein